MDVIQVSVLLVFIILFGTILAFFHKTEDAQCACASDWRKTYLKVYITAMIVYNVVLLVLALLGQPDNKLGVSGPLGALIGMAVAIAGQLFVLFGLQYVFSLREKHCKCAKGLGRDVLFWWTALLALSIVMSMLTVGLHLLSSTTSRSDVVKSLGKGGKRK